MTEETSKPIRKLITEIRFVVKNNSKENAILYLKELEYKAGFKSLNKLLKKFKE